MKKMKKFIYYCLCLFVIGLFVPAQAQNTNNQKEGEELPPQARTIKCLVLSNTSHFETVSPVSMRELVEKQGGVKYDFMSDLSTLNLSLMSDYDVIWIYNFAVWSRFGNIDPIKLSNLLADYVDAGGKLLECMYLELLKQIDNVGLNGGRFITEKYSPIEPTATLYRGSVNMAGVTNPNHPILKGVKNVSADQFTLSSNASANAEVLSSWKETGSPLVAIKGSIVSLNMAPIDINVMEPQMGVGVWVYGDAIKLIGNSVKWLFSQKYDNTAPNDVRNFTHSPVPVGASFDISLAWTNPNTTIEGNVLSKIDSVCVYRDNVKLTVLKQMVVGGVGTYTDLAVSPGVHEYTIYVYSDGKKGYPAKVSSFSGRDVPSAVDRLILFPDGNSGHITWNAPTVGVKNGWIDKTTLKYKIVRLPDNKVLSENTTATEYVDNTITKRSKYAYTVTPITGDGAGTPKNTSSMTLYTDGAIFMGTSDVTICQSKFYDPAGPNAIYPHDGNSYFLTIRPEHPELGEKTRVSFSKFDIESELLVFDGPDINSPQIKGSPFHADKVPSRLKEVTAGINNTSGALSFQFVTNVLAVAQKEGWEADISCVTPKNADLHASTLKGEILPSQNKKYIYKALIVNAGLESQTGFSVKLFSGTKSNVIETKEISQAIKQGDSVWVEFEYTPTVLGKSSLGFEVVLANDQNIANNVSLPLNINVQSPVLVDFKLGTGEISTMFGPIVFFHKSSVTESIYKPIELGVAKGEITAIRYYNRFSQEAMNENVVIHMCETDNVDLSYGWVDTSQMTRVFSGFVDFPYGENVISIPLDIPFSYKGKHLVIRVERPFKKINSEYELTESFYVYWDNDNPSHTLFWTGSESFNIDSAEQKDQYYAPQTGFVIDCKAAAQVEGVVSGVGGIALAGVKLQIENLPFVVYSDSQGHYSFPSLNTGSYTIKASKYDYEDLSVSVQATDGSKTEKNIAMTAIPKVVVKGVVKDNAGELVEGATVTLKGYGTMSGKTQADGTYTVNGVYANKSYILTVTKDLFHTYTAPFAIKDNDTLLKEITISQYSLPALGLIAVAKDKADTAFVSWKDPSSLNFNRLVFDDGTSETGIGVSSGKKGWFGSIFGVEDSGFICSVDVYGMQHAYLKPGQPSQRPVSIDIFNANREIMFSSQPFLIPADDWTTVNIPYFPYTGAFYVMVHYTAENPDSLTHALGCDTRGPNAESETNFWYDGSTWGVVQSFVQMSSFCFLIRTNVLSTSGTPLTIEPGIKAGITKGRNSTLSYDLASIMDVQKCKMLDETTILPIKASSPASQDVNSENGPKSYAAKYDLYRLKEKDLSNTSAWTKIATLDNSKYVDLDWKTMEQGSYCYAVQANYGPTLKSEYKISNSVHKEMFTKVTITCTSNTSKVDPSNMAVTLTNLDKNKEHIYKGVTDASGNVVISDVWKGIYTITISKMGFDKLVAADQKFETAEEYAVGPLLMKEKLRKPYNLSIRQGDEALSSDWDFSWNEARKIEDGFEGHVDFDINSPGKVGWSYRDVHEAITYSLAGVSYPHMNEPSAYQVYNPAQTTPPQTNSALAPYRGKKYIGCMASYKVQNDKWIFSPELNYANDFTFSFYAKSLDVSYGMERIMVGYSLSGTDEQDFVWLHQGEYLGISGQWTQYSYTVPAMATYVTIRSVSEELIMLMIDDIVIGDEKTEGGIDNILEYNVYLDGEKVSTTAEKTYKFTGITNPTEHKAGVEAVYESGKSVMSVIPFSTVGNEETKDLSNSIKIYPNPVSNYLVVEGAEDIKTVDIFNIQGVKIKSHKGSIPSEGLYVSDLASGTYLLKVVTLDGSAVKRFIKK